MCWRGAALWVVTVVAVHPITPSLSSAPAYRFAVLVWMRLMRHRWLALPCACRLLWTGRGSRSCACSGGCDCGPPSVLHPHGLLGEAKLGCTTRLD